MKDATLKQAAKILSIFNETPGDQIQALLESGLLTDLRDGNVAEVKRDNFRKLLSLTLYPPLLDLVGTVTISAVTSLFLAHEKFVVDTSKRARVGVSYLSDNFKAWFFEKEKIEESVAETTLRYAKLTKSSVDAPIRAEIGLEFEETTLAQIWALMERQKSGEAGVLLNTGHANIFYVKDVDGVLRAACIHWIGDGWRVDAYSIARPNRWLGGDQVFSRNAS